jgi:putative flippase GtrA
MYQFLKFGIVGLFNTLLGYAVIFSCMYLLKLSPILSNVLGYMVGLVVSYVLNRQFTFENKSKSKLQILRFLIVFAVSYAINLILLVVSMQTFGLQAGISQVIGGVGYVLTSFLLNKYYVFVAKTPAQHTT